MTITRCLSALAAIGVLLGFGVTAQAGATLDKVKQAGQISCGVATGVAGFGAPDSQGHWAGFNVDICRALSAAIFGAADKVKYVPLTAQQRFTALQSGEVELGRRARLHADRRAVQILGAFDAEFLRHHEALAVIEHDRREIEAERGIALQSVGCVVGQQIDLARLQSGEALLRG